MTKTGLVIGSCAYMAPERLSGKPGGPASDVYSLTCLLYECLTGRAPFEAGDLRAGDERAHVLAAAAPERRRGRGSTPRSTTSSPRGWRRIPPTGTASAGELAGRPPLRCTTARARRAHRRAQVPPHGTRQFPAFDPRPNPTGYVPQPPPRRRPPAAQAGTVRPDAGGAAGRRRSRRSRWPPVLAAVVVFTGGSGGSAAADAARRAARRRPRDDDGAVAARGVVGTVHHDDHKSPSPTAAVTGLSDIDAQGFVGHAARCDAGSTLVAAIRTASSLAVVCQTSPGSYYYHGERLRDGANVQLANATPVRRRVRRDEPGRRRAVSGAARRADHLEQRARRLGGGGAGVRRGLGGGLRGCLTVTPGVCGSDRMSRSCGGRGSRTTSRLSCSPRSARRCFRSFVPSAVTDRPTAST